MAFLPVMTSQPYYAQSPVLRGIVPNRNRNLTLFYASNIGKNYDFYMRTEHENLILQLKKILSYTILAKMGFDSN